MTFIALFFGILSSLVFANFTGVQSKARDTERITDIKSVHGQLEMHFVEKNYYPTTKEFSTKAPQLFPGLDAEALIDPNGKSFNSGGDYTYEPSGCNATECQDYTLSTQQESGSPYTQQSLN